MTTVRKFTFDLDFDLPEVPKNTVEETLEEEQEPEEVVPTFSEEDLASARAEGRKKGHEEGRKEAADATEQRLLEAIEKATESLSQVFNEQAEANRDIARDTISIATTIARKLFPDLNARNALGEVERVVQETLNAITEEPRVQIMVHPDLREPFSERLATMTHRAGFDGKVFINPDPGMTLGDCRVEWSNGAAVRDTNVLWEMIDEIVERNLHGPLEPGDDTPPVKKAPLTPPAESAQAKVPSEQTKATPDIGDVPSEPDAAETAETPAMASQNVTPNAPENAMEAPEEQDNTFSDQLVNNDSAMMAAVPQGDGDEPHSSPETVADDDAERFMQSATPDAVSPETTAAILAAQAEEEPDPSGQQ